MGLDRLKGWLREIERPKWQQSSPSPTPGLQPYPSVRSPASSARRRFLCSVARISRRLRFLSLSGISLSSSACPPPPAHAPAPAPQLLLLYRRPPPEAPPPPPAPPTSWRRLRVRLPPRPGRTPPPACCRPHTPTHAPAPAAALSSSSPTGDLPLRPPPPATYLLAPGCPPTPIGQAGTHRLATSRA